MQLCAMKSKVATLIRRIKNRVLIFMHRKPPNWTLAIKTHLTHEEKLTLHQIARSLPQKCVCLEIGSFLGASAAIIGCAIMRRNGVLHCVDTWQNQAMDEPERDTWPEFQRNVKSFGKMIIPHRGFSAIIANSLDLQLDFLFIDGDHRPEAVEQDLTSWMPKLRKNAVVALHDIGWAHGVKDGYEKHLRRNSNVLVTLPNLLIVQTKPQDDPQPVLT